MAVAVSAPGWLANRFLAPKARPLVVGHRGVPVLHQENTLAGFRRAVELGLDGIELDVRLTRDQRAVVFHDQSLERLTGERRSIYDMTWDELSRLRVRAVVETGRRFMRYQREEPISLLAEVLAEVGDDLAINIDVKPRWFDDDIASVVAEDIAAAGLTERVLVTSYDPRKLLALGRREPALALGYCWTDSFRGLGRRALNRLVDYNVAHHVLGVRAVGADHTLVGAHSTRLLHGAGVAIGTHVLFALDSAPRDAADVAEVERLVELGVDWIESDDPARLRELCR